jgi:putative PIN family toxin of toxin-antitoxin system
MRKSSKNAVSRAVVDTNVWVSAVLNPNGAPARIKAALQAQAFTLVVSTPMLAELADVLMRPRITRKYGVTQHDVTELVVLLRRAAVVVPISGTVQLCRDPDDDVVIETALRGQADMLVTRDDDLKRAPELGKILTAAGIAVITVQHFLDALDQQADAQ